MSSWWGAKGRAIEVGGCDRRVLKDLAPANWAWHRFGSSEGSRLQRTRVRGLAFFWVIILSVKN
ncbi:MAG: hypothetical protein WDZ46_09195, partial [Solirubrobacterales bacterium]